MAAKEGENLLQTTARLKNVRGEVTKKLLQCKGQYEEMHVRALTAELEVTNLQLKVEYLSDELDRQKDTLLQLSRELSTKNLLATQQDTALSTAKEKLAQLRRKLEQEIVKVQDGQKELRVGINSFMRCIFEFRTGAITQDDFLCAVDLIFSSLAAHDQFSTLSTSSPSFLGSASHVEVLFGSTKLQELASLPPTQRRLQLERIVDRLDPESLFCPSPEPHLVNGISTPSTPPPPPVPPKPQVRTQLHPPPLPPKPKHISGKVLIKPLNAPIHSSAYCPIATGGLDSDSDSEVDFEEMEQFRKDRSKGVGGVKLPCKRGTTSRLLVREKLSRVSKKTPLLPFQRSKSHELLLDTFQDCSDSSGSQESSISYALPFQHLQSWRKMMGLEDSSVLTGSLPSLHDLDLDSDSLCYIVPNEFRSFVSHVRGESIKMGPQTRQRAMSRVDSFVKSRLSRTSSALSNRPEYLTLLDDERMQDIVPVRRKTKPLPQIPPKRMKPVRVNYENQAGTRCKQRNKSIRGELSISTTPLSPPLEERFDDPVYDQSIKSNKSYIYEGSPSPTLPALIEPPKATPKSRTEFTSQFPQGTWAGRRTPSPKLEDKKSHTVSSPIPKRRNARLLVRESEPVLSHLPSSTKAGKPVPMPRRKLSKPDIGMEVEKSLLQPYPQVHPHQQLEDGPDKEIDPKPPFPDHIPVYFTLRHNNQSLRLIPMINGSPCSDSDEEDPGDYSLGEFHLVMNKPAGQISSNDSKRTILPPPSSVEDGASSTDSSDTEYVIPPDAQAGFVEDDPAIDRQMSRVLTHQHPSKNDILGEKQGYMHKLDPRLKNWTRRWFVLKGKELKYYRSKECWNGTKPKGVINLAQWCRITRHEMTSSFQLATPTRTYHFVADSNIECEEWIKALQTVMRMCQSNSVVSATADHLAGWAKVQLAGGYQQPQLPNKVWLSLVDQSLSMSYGPKKEVIVELDMNLSTVHHASDGQEFRHRSHSLFSRQKDDFTIIVDIQDVSTVEEGLTAYISLPSKSDKDLWFFHLMAACSGDIGPELTLTETLVARMMRYSKEEASNVCSALWDHPELNHTHEFITEPLTSLPSSSLCNDAVQMFRTVHLFIMTKFNPLGLDYHIFSVQQLASKCLAQPDLRDELYCQILRQISGTPITSAINTLQGWYLLFLLMPVFLPRRKLFRWYLHALLKQKSQSPVLDEAEFAEHCLKRLAKAEKNNPRENKPSWFELFSQMSRSVPLPRMLQYTMTLPVELTNESIEMSFDSSTTVQEFVSHLNQEVGLPDAKTTGFALMSDWPGEEDMDGFYLFPGHQLCDFMSLWCDSLSELGGSCSSPSTRMIRLTYRNRLSFESRRGMESDKEAVLLAFQFSKDALTGCYPVNTIDFAINIAALMAQIEYGDCSSMSSPEQVAREAVKRFCPIKFTKGVLPHDLEMLVDKMRQIWRTQHGMGKHQSARSLLRLLADHWDLFGATLFFCKDKYLAFSGQKNMAVWLAIHEKGVSLLNTTLSKIFISYSYDEVSTFGGHGEDFMLVVNSQHRPTLSRSSPSLQTEKILLSMPKMKIREATYLMASYLDSRN